uniref:Cytochrome b6-f complex subunit VII n=1 Tax=Cyanidium sp. THAL103 TaxID=3027999 RepID=A0A9Y1I3Y3_9RHOD|nr:cytochrome b6-f complex subunit VII [Cyanidium sp. THAL103]
MAIEILKISVISFFIVIIGLSIGLALLNFQK